MPSYTLELELFSLLNVTTSDFEIWADGALLGGYSSVVSSSGSTISLTVNYGGALPSSLEFRFNDTAPGSTDQIEIRSVKINDKYVNTGNYLSNNILNNGGSSTVDITNSDFIFDNSDPVASEFTTGATQAFTNSADTYRNWSGTSDEIFNMLDGRDVAYLGSGNDKVSGGLGNDIIRGGGGADLLQGDAGDDRLYGGIGNDRLYGGIGNDRIHGNAGDDEIHGGDGDDRLNGHDGNDTIAGGLGADKLNGGTGNDFLFGGDNNDALVGGTGNDTLDGGGGDDILYGGGGNDHINGGDGEDSIIGGQGLDIIHGNAGNDRFWLQINDWNLGEAIYGGADADELILAKPMVIDFTTGTLTNLETLTGSGGDDDVTINIATLSQFTTVDLGGNTSGDIMRVQIDGLYDAVTNGVPTVLNSENGYLLGSVNADTLITGEAEIASLVYGSGTIDMGASSDTISLSETSTTLNTLGATDSLIINLETITANGAAAGVIIDMAAQSENLIITGSSLNDQLTGGSGDDTVTGGVGNDIIYGDDPSIAAGTFPGWYYQYYDLGVSPTTLATAGFTLNGGRDNSNVETGNGITTNFDPSLIDSGDNFALKFTTTLTINTAGFYNFAVRSDDGSALFVDGVRIVNNDGVHTPITAVAGGNLTAGTHLIEVVYFDQLTGQTLEVDFSGPDTGFSFTDLGTYGDVEASLPAPPGGNDTLYGGDGDDIIYGGEGDDVIYSSDATAQTAVADILAANAGVFYNESTGNFYEVVQMSGSSSVTFAAAQTHATSNTINAVSAHLATITLAAEDSAFPSLVANNRWYWIGMDDTASEGTFRWNAGPEAGELVGPYTKWFGGSPGGSGNSGARDYVIYAGDVGDTWYVWPNAYGYLAEWEGDLVLGTTGTDTIYGGDGSDVLYGTDGIQNIFMFMSGETGTDTIYNFTAADTDAFNITDILTGFTPGTSDINDFARFVNSGANSLLQVDNNGTTGGASFTTIATVMGVNNLDAEALYYNESIIV